MLRSILGCIFVVVFTYSVFARQDQGEPLLYDVGGSSGWVPFGYTGNPDNPGVLAEVVEMVLVKASIPYLKKFFPPKRAQQLLYEGQLDFDFTSPAWFTEGDVGEQFVVSRAVFDVTEYFVSLPENAHKFQFPESIENQLVGTVSGYYYFDDKIFNRADFLSESELVLGLKMRRFPVAILEQHAASYWSKVHNVPLSLASVHTKGSIVMRFQKRHAHLLPAINEAIDELRASGEIEAILEKYLQEFVYSLSELQGRYADTKKAG